MDNKYNVGERIVISLNNGDTFEGDYLKTSDKGIEIENIHHYESGNKTRSRFWFYRREIKTIHKLTTQKGAVSDSTSQQTKISQSKNCILLDKDEYERLKEVAANFIYVKTEDKSYFDAVTEIKNFESVGVFAVGAEKGRCGKISVIALSTWKQVYIFDIKNFRSTKFPAEIAEILESFYIKKIVHNGGTLKDCLQYSHKITMNNIFDTQVSHMMLVKNATGECPKSMNTIGQCLVEYFNFSPTLLSSSLEALSESWIERPLEEDKLKKLSRLVTYLITVKDYQMNLMLKDYEKAVNSYHNLFTKSTEFEMVKLAAIQECTEDIDTIIPRDLLKSGSIETVKAIDY
ncbi:hypothetical protein WA026_022091 [Henosepilachna vigintioctopunctata]|uniref:3'-5' exonuclease domain-containing protein n=1 Tax=Henosepilachna vigintioctopunctata TaxID=420089 RepID=A0AAW1UCN5_9CUCU